MSEFEVQIEDTRSSYSSTAKTIVATIRSRMFHIQQLIYLKYKDSIIFHQERAIEQTIASRVWFQPLKDV